MAGRPKKMLETVTEWERLSILLSADVYGTCPKQYHERYDPRFPLNIAWQVAVKATLEANIALEALGDLIRIKAGSTAISPWEEIVADDDPQAVETRKPRPSTENDDTRTGDDGKATTGAG